MSDEQQAGCRRHSLSQYLSAHPTRPRKLLPLSMCPVSIRSSNPRLGFHSTITSSNSCTILRLFSAYIVLSAQWRAQPYTKGQRSFMRLTRSRELRYRSSPVALST
jgi:hypothetical protein